jgi:L-lactate dehydrogenase complex protein LldE
VRVELFVTCLGDTLFPHVGISTVTLLERLGCQVDFDPRATCCGQMHMNSGYGEQASRLARMFVDTYRGSNADAVVVPSGSCASAIRHHYDRLGVDAAGVPPVYELSEFLVDALGVTDVGATFPHRVTYHPTCHSLRLLGVGDRPYQLLRAVAGLQLIDLPEADQCCGFGGTFAVKNADVSSAMCADKVAHVRQTGAEVLVAGDSSCLMHIDGMLSRTGTPIRVLHLAEVLASTADAPTPVASRHA